MAKQAVHRYPGQGRGWTVIFNYTFLIFLALLYIFPFLVQVSNSFKTDFEATNAGLSLWSDNWTTAAYNTLFNNSNFPVWVQNSFIVTLFVTAGRVFFNCLAGYALARLQFRGRTLIFAGLIAVMSVPGVVLLIPKFLVINQLGIYDTYLGMIVPLLVDAAGIFIMKNFFESIPVSVEEAARVDGAGTFRIGAVLARAPLGRDRDFGEGSNNDVGTVGGKARAVLGTLGPVDADDQCEATRPTGLDTGYRVLHDRGRGQVPADPLHGLEEHRGIRLAG